MDEMMVPPESQSAEADSEDVAQDRTEGDTTDQVQSSENLAVNVSNHPASSDDTSPIAAASSHTEENQLDGSDEPTNPDQVSSSTESYPGLARNNLPSINHQSVLIPNMEPYLEEGSLDGTSKDLQDPSSSNSNPSDSESKVTIDSSNQPDNPNLNQDDSSTGLAQQAESSTTRTYSELDHTESSSSQPVEVENGEIETSHRAPDGEEVNASCSDQPDEGSPPLNDAGANSANVGNSSADIGENSGDVGASSADVEDNSGDVGASSADVGDNSGDVEDSLADVRASSTDIAAPHNPDSQDEPSSAVDGPSHPQQAETGDDENVVEASREEELNGPAGEGLVSSLTEEEAMDLPLEQEAECTPAHNVDSAELTPDEHVAETADSESDSAHATEAGQGNEVDSSTFVADNPLSADETAFLEPEGRRQMQEYDEPDVQGGEADGGVEPEEPEHSPVPEQEQSVDHEPVREAEDREVYQDVENPTIPHEVANLSLDQEVVEPGLDQVVVGSALDHEIVRPETDQENIGPSVCQEAAHPSSNQEVVEPSHEGHAGVPALDQADLGPSLDQEPLVPALDQETLGSVANSESGTINSSSQMGAIPDTEAVVEHSQEYDPNRADLEASADLSSSDQHTSPPLLDANPTEEAECGSYPMAEPSEEMAPVEPATVCEADSSAAGMEEQAYDAQDIGSSQNVYLVGGEGQMALSSVPQSASMTPFHNSENAMLVEMAPLATENGSFVNTQVQYVETGQEGMITDAQAAELLMRVSEQRPISLQSLQQDTSVAGGPYVQVQLAQTVEGITHLVEVPVSALAGYCLQPSTLVYTTPSGTVGGGSAGEMATWVMEAPAGATGSNGVEHQSNQNQATRLETNKFSDIVSASIEAIGFPESVTPGANILSHAEQILISSDGQHQQQQQQHNLPPSCSVATSAAASFEFDDSNSNSSLTLTNDKNHTTATYPRPKRESIESRIHRLLRGANAPAPESGDDHQSSLSSNSKTTAPKSVKLTSLPPNRTSSTTTTVSNSTSSSTVMLNLPKQPGRLDSRSNPGVRTVTIPAVFTAANQSASKPSPLPPGSSDYFMPRGMSKRKAQGTFKPTKVNPSKPGCIDADPAPPEETKVKLVMNSDTVDDDDQLEDDEYNRAVLLQARQRKQQMEQVSVRLDHHMSSTSKHNFPSRSPSTVLLSLPNSNNKTDDGATANAASGSTTSTSDRQVPSKRVRLSFPPDIYANLEEEVSSAYMAELQTPKLTYTIPRTRQTRAKGVKEEAGIDNPIKEEPEINVRLPWMVEEDEELKRKQRVPPPRIIRQQNTTIANTGTPAPSSSRSAKLIADDIDADSEVVDEPGQVIVIGLDETGQQPSEEQLTAIIQAAMAKREAPSSNPDRPAVQSSKSARSPHAVGTPLKPTTPAKRKADEENGVEVEENGVRLKVIRTYDRNVGVPRRKPPRSKKLSSFSIEIFDYEDEDEEEDEEEVDDLERFSQALADEEQAIREKEKKVSPNRKESDSPSGPTPSFRAQRGRGRGRGAKSVSYGGSRDGNGKGGGRNFRQPASRGRRVTSGTVSDDGGGGGSEASEAEEEEEDSLAYKDDVTDDDYKPIRGRGRSSRGAGGRSRGRGRRGGGRRRVAFKQEEENEEETELGGGDEEEVAEDEEEERIPGMPSKPCPQCEERFTTREGFLDHIATHSSAKCLICDWKSPSPKEKNRLKQHMLNSHAGSIPAAAR